MAPPWSRWADKEPISKLKNSREVRRNPGEYKKKKKKPTYQPNKQKNFLGKGGTGDVLFTKLRFCLPGLLSVCGCCIHSFICLSTLQILVFLFLCQSLRQLNPTPGVLRTLSQLSFSRGLLIYKKVCFLFNQKGKRHFFSRFFISVHSNNSLKLIQDSPRILLSMVAMLSPVKRSQLPQRELFSFLAAEEKAPLNTNSLFLALILSRLSEFKF